VIDGGSAAKKGKPLTLALLRERVQELSMNELQNMARLLLVVLSRSWHQLPVEYAFGDTPEGEPRKDRPPPLYPIPPGPVANDESFRAWLWLAENFVALQIATYLSQFFVQMRNLVFFVMVTPFVTMLAIISYPYQPQRPLLLLVLLLFAAVLVQGIAALRQMEHDPVLSRIANTTPNRVTLDRDFFATISPYLLPVAGVILALVSEFTGVLSSWLGSVSRVFQ
jgi:hypothetical protein